MFNFIGYIASAPLRFAKKFLASPIASLFYGLVGKWYIITMTLSVIVIYWVINGLNKAGVLTLALDEFVSASKQIKGFAQHCTPMIRDLNAFFRCMMDTPEYTGDEITSAFEEDMKQEVQNAVDHPINHNKIYLLSPYDIDEDGRPNNSNQNTVLPPPR